MAFSPAWKDDNMELLVQALLNLETEEEVYRLLSDLCTIKEIKDMAQRMEVAYFLDRDITYNNISSKTGASTATISRVKRCLYHGDSGYRTILDRINQKEKEQSNEK